jgi:polysaccharide pyruvyl transferase CsaB
MPISSSFPSASDGRLRRNVLILAGDTDGNLGDRAIVLATCEELRRLDPLVRITIVSGDPERDRSFFGADTIPRGPRGLLELAKAARRSELVLCGGGGLFQDDTSLVKMPYWALRLALVRSLTRRIIGYSLGVGPLDRASSRLAARLAFLCMQAVSVRDRRGMSLVEDLTTKPVWLVPDPSLLLTPAPPHETDALLREVGLSSDASPLIGVAVRRCFHQYPSLIPHEYAERFKLRRIPGREACDRMISLLAVALDRASERENATVLFLPTYNVPHEGDDRISLEIMERMSAKRKALLRIRDPRLYKALASRLGVMLGGRMHPTILCASVGTPVVGLSYNQKFRGFFELIGRGDKVIDVWDFVNGELTRPLANLLTAALGEGSSTTPEIVGLSEETRRFTARLMDGTLPEEGERAPVPDPGESRGRWVR